MEHLRNSNRNVQLLPSEEGGLPSHSIASFPQNAMNFIHGPKALISLLVWVLKEYIWQSWW